MKNRNTVFTVTLVAFAFALASGIEAGPRPDGGPTHNLFSTTRSNANSDAEASSTSRVSSFRLSVLASPRSG